MLAFKMFVTQLCCARNQLNLVCRCLGGVIVQLLFLETKFCRQKYQPNYLTSKHVPACGNAFKNYILFWTRNPITFQLETPCRQKYQPNYLTSKHVPACSNGFKNYILFWTGNPITFQLETPGSLHQHQDILHVLHIHVYNYMYIHVYIYMPIVWGYRMDPVLLDTGMYYMYVYIL